MLHSIELDKYRGFDRYRLRDLSRVNLLVGKNNCGKTSILEAVHFLAAGGDPGVLTATAWRRGEIALADARAERHAPEAYPVISHFFHGHEFSPGAYFTVRSHDGLADITVRVVTIADLEGERLASQKQRRLFDEYREQEGLHTAFAVQFAGTSDTAASEPWALPVTENGLVFESPYRFRRAPKPEQRGAAPVQFISPDSLEPHSMSEMWNRVLTEGRESEVIRALQILEPNLEKVLFLSGESAYRYAGRAGVLLAFKNIPRRDPLGSHGDGMRRLLALSLALIQSQRGVLLIDEIDTGLHYSVMADMWRLLVEAARQSHVQVFATTHSLDCVRGLASLCEDYPDLGAEVSLQKVDCDLQEAVALNAERIVLAVQQGMEVR